jgi:hypothetical protein
MGTLISQTLCPAHAHQFLTDLNATEQYLRQWNGEANEECEKIRLYLLHKDLHTHDKKVMAALVENYQEEIVYLMNILADYKKMQPHPLLSKLYDNVIMGLKGLINLLRRRYLTYFNQLEKIPDVDLQQYRIELRARIRNIKRNLTPVIADKKLLQLLLIPLCQFGNYRLGPNPTYSELEYMKDLVKKLTAIRHTCGDGKIDRLLIKLLITYNFNSTAFIDYYIQSLELKAESLHLSAIKSSYFAFQHKMLLYIKERPGISLQREMPSAKEELLDWVEDQNNYLEELRFDTEAFTYNEPRPADAGLNKLGKNEAKITTLFSVPEFALFIRALNESSIIHCLDRRGFLKKICMNFTTVGTENTGISWISLNSKYSAVEQETIQSLRKKIRLLNDYLRELELGLS